MPTPDRRPVVVKLGGSVMGGGTGGSLTERGDLDRLLDEILAAGRPVVVVPGGGLFADAVRESQARLGFSESLAHRLALDAMGHFAEVLAERRPAFARAATDGDLAHRLDEGRPVLWDPVSLRAGDPDLAESWDVTSDSLALFLAARIGARAAILIKSAEPGAGGDLPGRLVAAGYLDRAFPAFLARYSGIVRLLGPADHGRLAAAIDDPAAAIGLRLPGRETGD